MSGAEQDRLISLQAAAELLSIAKRGVYRLIARGDLPQPVKVGSASRLLESEVRGYISRLIAERGR
jgi:excisionase family DNA binding protein